MRGSAGWIGWLVIGAVFASSAAVQAGKYNPVRNLGDPAPAWEKLPGVDGKTHSLADLKDKPVVVVVFTCNSCPYAVDYEDRLIAFAKKYAGPKDRVALVAINANLIPDDSPEKMKQRAEEKGFNFPYLFDEKQEVARGFGATFTPEFFVLDAERKIVYMGAMDDNSDPEKVEHHYLEEAVQAVLRGQKPATAETPAVGCLIRYKRSRKK